MALTHGDQFYDHANWVYHYTHHPKAPVTYSISDIMQSAYFSSQHQARILLQQSSGYDMRVPEDDGGVQRWTDADTSSEWVGIARCWVDMPPQTTHIKALLTYAVSNTEECKVECRVGIRETENNSEYQHTPSAQLQLRIIQDHPNKLSAGWGPYLTESERLAAQGRFILSPHTYGYILYQDVQECPIDPNSSNTYLTEDDPGLCEIRVEMRANEGDGGTYDTPSPILPAFVTIVAVMRY